MPHDQTATILPPGAALRLHHKAAGIEALALDLEMLAAPVPGPDECVIAVEAAGVNMSDVKAALGQMPQACWPRTPGRDYAGRVVAGPAAQIGREVWGSSGALGIRRDGSHARYLLLDTAELADKPAALSFDEAGSIGVPFITAWQGLAEAGGVGADDVVLVLGASGKVGQAVVQIASMQGARVFAVTRGGQPYAGHASAAVESLDADSHDIAQELRARTGGHGASLVYNTVGSPYFVAGCAAMAHGGRQVFISTLDRAVPFDIFTFFRGRHRFFGVDSLGLPGPECAAIMRQLAPGFASGQLQPFPIAPDAVFPLARAGGAYAQVWQNSRARMVLRPAG